MHNVVPFLEITCRAIDITLYQGIYMEWEAAVLVVFQ